MATVLELVQKGVLHKLDAQLSWRELEQRMIFVFPKVARWMMEVLPDAVSDRLVENTPIEQLDAFSAEFCGGKELVIDRQVRPIRHISHGIWELKTADLRLFGWFVRRDCFICSAANTTYNVKRHDLYNGYRDEACRHRDELELDEPKYVPGDNPDDVLSAWCYPPP